MIFLFFIGVIAAVVFWVLRYKLFVAAAIFVAFVGLGGSCMNSVPAKNVGIVTAWGKPTGRTTGAGMHLTEPWQDIEDWDATRQSYNHLGDPCKDLHDGSLWVTIASGRSMCLHVQVEWESVDTKRASDNWATYREVDDLDRFAVFTARRVNPQINDALIGVFRTFDPLAGANANTGDVPAPDLTGLYSAKVKQEITTRIGTDVSITSIAFGSPVYDAPTQGAIAAYGQKVLEARNLAVDKANAETRRAIAGQSGLTPFQQVCLDEVKATGKGEPGFCSGSSSVALTKQVG